MNNLTFIMFAALSLSVAHSSASPPIAHGQSAHAQSSTATFRIKGMMTPNCPVLVKAAVSRMDGVVAVDASLEKKQAVVEYDPAKTSPEAIKKVIKDRAGFDSEIVR